MPSNPSNRRSLLLATTSIVAAAIPTGSAHSAPVGDRELLAMLVGIEQIQIAHYAAFLNEFDASAFSGAGFPEDVRDQLAELLEAEQEQIAVLGGASSASGEFMVADSVAGAIQEAIAIENFATAAYAGVIVRLDRRGPASELLGIHSVEARHATWLGSLVGVEPFSAAVDLALAPGDVLAEIDAILDSPGVSATPVGEDDRLAAALDGIAAELGTTREALHVVNIEPRSWPDSALGCPVEGEMYAQVITPGFKIEISLDGEEITFHTDEEGRVVRCS